MSRKPRPLAECANGCGVPPCPPSLVICRACMDAITLELEEMERRMAERDPAAPTVAELNAGIGGGA